MRDAECGIRKNTRFYSAAAAARRPRRPAHSVRPAAPQGCIKLPVWQSPGSSWERRRLAGRSEGDSPAGCRRSQRELDAALATPRAMNSALRISHSALQTGFGSSPLIDTPRATGFGLSQEQREPLHYGALRLPAFPKRFGSVQTPGGHGSLRPVAGRALPADRVGNESLPDGRSAGRGCPDATGP